MQQHFHKYVTLLIWGKVPKSAKVHLRVRHSEVSCLNLSKYVPGFESSLRQPPKYVCDLFLPPHYKKTLRLIHYPRSLIHYPRKIKFIHSFLSLRLFSVCTPFSPLAPLSPLLSVSISHSVNGSTIQTDDGGQIKSVSITALMHWSWSELSGFYCYSQDLFWSEVSYLRNEACLKAGYYTYILHLNNILLDYSTALKQFHFCSSPSCST